MKKYSPLLAAALLLSAPAFANEKQVSVGYKDLNLTSTSGQETLDGRIQDAAAQVCTADGAMLLEKAQIIRRCRSMALADARHKAKTIVARANSDTQLAAR
jgi:UrcA family protein